MKIRRIFSLLAVVCLVFAQSVSAKTVSATGILKEKEVRTDDFTKLVVCGQFNVYLTQSYKHKVSIKTYNSLMPYVEVDQAKGVLTVKMDRYVKMIRWGGKEPVLDLYIAMENPEKIQLSGSCDLFIQNDLRVTEFSLKASGASDIQMKDLYSSSVIIRNSGACEMHAGCISTKDLDLKTSGVSEFKAEIQAADVELRASGASDFKLCGQAGTMDIFLSGTGTIEALDLEAQDVDLRANGTSNCRIAVQNTLETNLSGASTLYYTGDAVLKSMEVSGAASIKKRNG